MNKTLDADEFVVYDEFLNSQEFSALNSSAQSEEYSIPHIERWLKVWRISDGMPMGSKSYTYKANEPILNDNYMSCMATYFKEISKQNPKICPEDWDELTLRCYLYGRETKLSWHNDKGYVAAGIFYCHDYWASTWGGELMIARTPKIEGEGRVPDPSINHTFEDKFLEYYGCGQYITCKPNRLVLTKGGVWHSINRVDKDAGDHIRMTIVAFFIKK